MSDSLYGTSPARTAWLLIGYVGAAFLVDYLLSRRELLQVRLPDRAVQFRGIADLSDDIADSERIDLQRLRDARLHPWQHAAAWL